MAAAAAAVRTKRQKQNKTLRIWRCRTLKKPLDTAACSSELNATAKADYCIRKGMQRKGSDSDWRRKILTRPTRKRTKRARTIKRTPCPLSPTSRRFPSPCCSSQWSLTNQRTGGNRLVSRTSKPITLRESSFVIVVIDFIVENSLYAGQPRWTATAFESLSPWSVVAGND